MSSSLQVLARRIGELQREVRSLSTQPQLGYSAIEGGSIESYDDDGNLGMIIGTQHDGTQASAVVGGPVPPTPFMPGVESMPGGLKVVWSGLYEDDAAMTPMDFARVEIHVSTDALFSPDSFSLRGSFSSPRGGEYVVALSEVVEHYVGLVTRSESGKASPMSVLVAGTPGVGVTGVIEEQFTAPAAGAQSFTLANTPKGTPNVHWGVLYVQASEYTITGNTISIPDPDGAVRLGDVFSVLYDY